MAAYGQTPVLPTAVVDNDVIRIADVNDRALGHDERHAFADFKIPANEHLRAQSKDAVRHIAADRQGVAAITMV